MPQRYPHSRNTTDMKTNNHSISLNGGKVYDLWALKPERVKLVICKGDTATAICDKRGNCD